MPIKTTTDSLLKRGQIILSTLPIDQNASKGMYVAIEVIAQDYEISKDAESAKRQLLRKGYTADSIAVIQL